MKEQNWNNKLIERLTNFEILNGPDKSPCGDKSFDYRNYH